MNVLGWQVVRSKCPLCNYNFPEKSGSSRPRDDKHVEQAIAALKSAAATKPSLPSSTNATSLKPKESNASLNSLQTAETGYSTSSSASQHLSVNKSVCRKASQESLNSMSSMSSLDTDSSVEHEVVCGMPYSYYFPDDDRYLDGYYTGQAEATTGLPHGMGTWRSSDGRSFMEGDWNAGRLYVRHPDRTASQATSSRRSSGTRHRRSATLNSSHRRCSLERIAEYDLGRSYEKDTMRSTSSRETSRGRPIVVGKADFQGLTSSVPSGRRSRSESRSGRYRRPANSEEDFCQSDTALLDSARRHRPRHGSFDLDLEDDLNDSFRSITSILRPPKRGSADFGKSNCASTTVASKMVRFDLMLSRKSSITLDNIDCDNSVAMESCYRAQENKDCKACDMSQLEKVFKSASFSVDPPGLSSSLVTTRKQTYSRAA